MLNAHWEAIFAVDFTTEKVGTKTGLTTFYFMVTMELKTRREEIAGITTNPNRQRVKKSRRTLLGGNSLREIAFHPILDRDTCFQPLHSLLKEQTYIEPVLLPPKSPNMIAYLERFMRSPKIACLNNLIFSVSTPSSDL